MSVKEKNIGGKIVLTLFWLPFATVGIFIIFIAFQGMFKSFEAKNWAEAEATITELKLTSPDGNSYDLKVSYNYECRGIECQGTKFQVSSVNSSHEKDAYKMITARKKDNLITCYVNPDKPEEATLLRDIMPKQVLFILIFGIVFGGAGLLILYVTWFFKFKGKLILPKKDYSALLRNNWKSNKISDNSDTTVIYLIILTVFWNLVSLFPLFTYDIELEAGNKDGLIFLILFSLAGVIMLFVTIYKIMRYCKYGKSYFVMETFPGVVGGYLKGVIQTTNKVVGAERFVIELHNVKRTVRRRGDNDSVSEKTLWQDKLTLNKMDDAGSNCTELPVNFTIPETTRESESPKKKSRILWRLIVSAETPGVDYKTQFEIPIFNKNLKK